MSESVNLTGLPDRVVVDQHGHFWQDFGDYWSMCRVSDENVDTEVVATYRLEAHAAADLLDVGDIPHLFRLRIDYSPGMKEKFEQPDWHAVIERWPAGGDIVRSDSYGDTLPELVAAISTEAR